MAPTRLFTPTAATPALVVHPRFLQEPGVQRHAADVGRGDPVDKRRGGLGQHGRPEPDPWQHRAHQRHRAGQVGHGRQGDDQRQPRPVGRLDGLPAASHLCQLRQQVVERARGRGDRQQRSWADALDAGQFLVFPAARRGGSRPGLGQQAVMAGDRAAGAGGQSQRLQQRHRGRDAVRADDRGGAADRPVGPDHGGQRGQQLGDVERHLPLGGAQFGEAEVDDPGPARTVDHDVGRPQRAVRDPRPVQPIHLFPQLPEHRVADALAPGIRSRELPSTRSIASSADPSAVLITWRTAGTATPARSAMTAASAWCSTAWMSEAAGRVSPTSRSRMNR